MKFTGIIEIALESSYEQGAEEEIRAIHSLLLEENPDIGISGFNLEENDEDLD
jgi:hypothetical protein